jgi:hypothetical protein
MRCQLSWGANGNLEAVTPLEGTATKDHSVRLDGLARFRSYSFQVTSTEGERHFRSDAKKARTKLWWLF